MLNSRKKVTIELLNKNGSKENTECSYMSNPISENSGYMEKLGIMVREIIDSEIPKLAGNSLIYDLVLYSLTEKIKTVQNVENVLSYIRENKVKEVSDISFGKGEIRIKCSV